MTTPKRSPVAAAAAQAAVAGFGFVVPEPRTVQLRDRSVEITPLKVGEIGAFSRAITPLVGWLPSLVGQDASPEVMLQMLSLHSDDALQAVSVAARQPLEVVAELQLDELLELASVCLEVNADFFRRALPQLERSAARVQATFSAGAQPSSS